MAEEPLRQRKDSDYQRNEGDYIHPAESCPAFAIHGAEDGSVEAIFAQ
jgi:hypothetical protein